MNNFYPLVHSSINFLCLVSSELFKAFYLIYVFVKKLKIDHVSSFHQRSKFSWQISSSTSAESVNTDNMNLIETRTFEAGMLGC